ncbi:Aldo keto reductase [Coniophora puteana RWD-64-598 SS2]|uniref:Aldo keto reductase n=1 Tax=Coniophora puteana (strain RWD-64-598) TaxID=741705 RepID=A0A5M3MLH9_CONPW|nr:Aldo keto reductase [Coniophora puteana RWD-64-598 SS2]EIW79887.1 Aldo keto reductase [Coniophora puteana RWD-64-598 SS2]
MTFPTRKIGTDDVSAIGFGAMGISAYYGAFGSDEERFEILDAAYERGCRFWDTANIYGDSEDLIGKWFKRTGKRNDIFLATKFGISRETARGVDGTPESCQRNFARSLERLGVDTIDLYYLHRPDSEVPIEETVAEMAKLVKAGKVKYLGLSECTANTLRRAHKVHPIAALQVEYSPFTLDIEGELNLLKTARELGVKVIAYSPLGRGLITGQYKSPDDFEADDFRRKIPRYSKENFPNILKLADGLKKVGDAHSATAGQVALAWLLAQGDDVIPIPGTKKIKYLNENLDAVNVKLTAEDVKEVRTYAEKTDHVNGLRYPEFGWKTLYQETPEQKL